MEINRNTLLWVVIAILAILVIYVVFFQGGASSGSAASDTLTPTAQAAQAYSGMVGGC